MCDFQIYKKKQIEHQFLGSAKPHTSMMVGNGGPGDVSLTARKREVGRTYSYLHQQSSRRELQCRVDEATPGLSPSGWPRLLHCKAEFPPRRSALVAGRVRQAGTIGDSLLQYLSGHGGALGISNDHAGWFRLTGQGSNCDMSTYLPGYDYDAGVGDGRK